MRVLFPPWQKRAFVLLRISTESDGSECLCDFVVILVPTSSHISPECSVRLCKSEPVAGV